jgi:hypothetical protein
VRKLGWAKLWPAGAPVEQSRHVVDACEPSSLLMARAAVSDAACGTFTVEISSPQLAHTSITW